MAGFGLTEEFVKYALQAKGNLDIAHIGARVYLESRRPDVYEAFVELAAAITGVGPSGNPHDDVEAAKDALTATIATAMQEDPLVEAYGPAGEQGYDWFGAEISDRMETLMIDWHKSDNPLLTPM